MTEWNKIYNGKHLSTADKFTFVTLPCITWPEPDSEEFLKSILPADKKDSPMANARAKAHPESAIRMMLCSTMSSTFCIGMGSRNDQTVFYIGARREQDLFKLILKIPGVNKTNSWPREMKFSIRVAANDDYDPERHLDKLQRGMA